jgi:hypothetical protein
MTRIMTDNIISGLIDSEGIDKFLDTSHISWSTYISTMTQADIT